MDWIQSLISVLYQNASTSQILEKSPQSLISSRNEKEIFSLMQVFMFLFPNDRETEMSAKGKKRFWKGLRDNKFLIYLSTDDKSIFKISKNVGFALPFCFLFEIKANLTTRYTLIFKRCCHYFLETTRIISKSNIQGNSHIYFWKIRILYLIPELQWH